jgi:hypothetical protein
MGHDMQGATQCNFVVFRMVTGVQPFDSTTKSVKLIWLLLKQATMETCKLGNCRIIHACPLIFFLEYSSGVFERQFMGLTKIRAALNEI